MTAKELHDLYGPLWEKVPECQPKGLEWRESGAHWAHDDSENMGSGYITAEFAAALCRVAVEDWLIAHDRRAITVGPDADDPSWQVYEYRGGVGGASTAFGEGPTIHHALVAAAMAVAEAKE